MITFRNLLVSYFSHDFDSKNVIYPYELMNRPHMSQIKHHFSFQVFPRDFSCINERCSSWKIHEKDLTWPSRLTYLISFMWCVTCKILSLKDGKVFDRIEQWRKCASTRWYWLTTYIMASKNFLHCIVAWMIIYCPQTFERKFFNWEDCK